MAKHVYVCVLVYVCLSVLYVFVWVCAHVLEHGRIWCQHLIRLRCRVGRADSSHSVKEPAKTIVLVMIAGGQSGKQFSQFNLRMYPPSIFLWPLLYPQ